MLETDWTHHIAPYGGDQNPGTELEPAPAGVGVISLEPQPLVALPCVDVAGVIDDPSPPPAFIWDGFVPRGFVTLLSGHGGSGKSVLALQLAVAVAMGIPLLGVRTEPGRVLVFSGEDAGALLRHRLAAICRALDVNPRALAERLMVLDATETPVLGEEALDRETGRRFIAPTPVYGRLREIVTAWQPTLVIVDNASDAYEGNENERSMVRGFVRSLAVLSRQSTSHPAILLLTHTPKQAVGGRGESYSGSTAWHNSARARLSLTPTKDDDTRLVLSLDKMNLAPLCREQLRLVRAQGGVLALDEGARDADHDEGQSEPPELGVLRVLADFVERGEKVSAEPNAPRTNAWALLRPEPGFPKRAYKASGVLFSAMRQMERDGLIVKEPYRNQSRKDRVAWSLTTKGWEQIGKTAPSASSAPTPEVDAPFPLDAPGSAPSAPTPGAGGYRGERAHIELGAVDPDREPPI